MNIHEITELIRKDGIVHKGLYSDDYYNIHIHLYGYIVFFGIINIKDNPDIIEYVIEKIKSGVDDYNYKKLSLFNNILISKKIALC
jgi:hypothetical protein